VVIFRHEPEIDEVDDLTVSQNDLFPFLAGAVFLVVSIGVAIGRAGRPRPHGNIEYVRGEPEREGQIEPGHSTPVFMDDDRGLNAGPGGKEINDGKVLRLETIALPCCDDLGFGDPVILAHRQIEASQFAVRDADPKIDPGLLRQPGTHDQKKRHEKDNKPRHHALPAHPPLIKGGQ
jgi:hypothetical protein